MIFVSKLNARFLDNNKASDIEKCKIRREISRTIFSKEKYVCLLYISCHLADIELMPFFTHYENYGKIAKFFSLVIRIAKSLMKKALEKSFK